VVRKTEGTIWNDLEKWRPSRKWDSMVGSAAALLDEDRGSIRGWTTLVMMLGDSGAAGLALITCLHAQQLPASDRELSHVPAHRDVCLLQLGLAAPRRRGPIPVVEFGSPGVVDVDEPKLESWIAQQLQPFDGNLETAAEFILQLALARTGLRRDEPTL
jgi:hypothetical protein